MAPMAFTVLIVKGCFERWHATGGVTARPPCAMERSSPRRFFAECLGSCIDGSEESPRPGRGYGCTRLSLVLGIREFLPEMCPEYGVGTRVSYKLGSHCFCFCFPFCK